MPKNAAVEVKPLRRIGRAPHPKRELIDEYVDRAGYENTQAWRLVTECGQGAKAGPRVKPVVPRLIALTKACDQIGFDWRKAVAHDLPLPFADDDYELRAALIDRCEMSARQVDRVIRGDHNKAGNFVKSPISEPARRMLLLTESLSAAGIDWEDLANGDAAKADVAA